MNAMAKWVEDAVKYDGGPPDFTLDLDHIVCLRTLCVIVSGPHNLHPVGGWRRVRFLSGGMAINLRKDLATYDTDHLTRLVLAAHANSVRVDIDAHSIPLSWVMDDDQDVVDNADDDDLSEFYGPTVAVTRVMLHHRNTPLGRMSEGHPSLDDLVLRIRKLQGEGS